ncbi:MAG: caspase family protein [Xanthomonadales bacterium]|nr:caspase family protein [Xanthomonadales bacterium]
MKLFPACVAIALTIAGSPAVADQSWQPYVSSGGTLSGVQPIDSMMVVDCLLPGQMRRSGAMSYMGPRLPVKTTAQLCAMRGGEYTEYDRANMQSSLAVWMDKAKGGDATAQFYVGQIYEKGMDTAPDYEEAATWYRKAAAAGSNEAKLSLAAMMEAGHGMPADPTAAVNLYREAMGITGDELISKSESDTRVAEVERKNESLRTELSAQRAAAASDVDRLQGEVAALKSENANRKRDASKMAALERSLNEAMTARADADRKLTAMAAIPKSSGADGPTTRSVTVPRVSAATAESVAADGIKFGKYHALIIGVQNYISYDPLKTPISDAKAIADVLEQRYGFQTTTLLDADFSSIVGGIVQLSTKIGPDDNVLIYFAGHGVLNAAQRGFWLPLDARQSERSPALPTETLAEFLAMFKARSILVIADSCFGSALSGSVSSYTGGPTEYEKGIPSGYLSRKARYVLSSGGMSPVLDQAGDGHSVFASALLKVLRDNDRILTQTGLEQALVEPVRANAQQIGLVQTPDLKKVREAGDAGGAFFLVPKTVPDKG